MLMLWFPYDAHLVGFVIVGICVTAYRRHKNATVRRLERLMAHQQERV